MESKVAKLSGQIVGYELALGLGVLLLSDLNHSSSELLIAAQLLVEILVCNLLAQQDSRDALLERKQRLEVLLQVAAYLILVALLYTASYRGSLRTNTV